MPSSSGLVAELSLEKQIVKDEKTCAPPLSRDLDGGETADGWISGYVFRWLLLIPDAQSRR
jgi:hypothetical protein